MSKPDWRTLPNSERIDRLRQLLTTDKLSGAELAAHFAGVSRSAIIGFCGRHNIALPRRKVAPPPPSRPRKRLPKPAVAFGKPPAFPVVYTAAAPDPSVSQATLGEAIDRQLCKWPLWDELPPQPMNAPACGAPRDTEGPWCQHHARRALDPRRQAGVK